MAWTIHTWSAVDRVGTIRSPHFGPIAFEESSGHALQFWLGDCCEYCTPDPIRLRFEGVTMIDGLGEDVDMSDSLFRLASSAEIREHRLVVPDGARAFCIVTCHGQGRDGPTVLVVAREARILEPRSAAQGPHP